MVSQKIYDVLIPLKEKTIKKIKYNLNQPQENLNILKSEIKEINIYSTFERTFSTCLGLKLQEVAAVCGKVNYEDLCDTIKQVIRETYEEVQSVIISSL